MAIKTIEVRASEIQSKAGQKFLAYLCKKKDGTWATMKFTKDCENQVKKEGRYDLEINTENMNRSTDNFGREVWWVREKVESVNPHKFEDKADEEF